MGSAASASDEAMRKRKAAKETNFWLEKQLCIDDAAENQRKVLYLSTKETQALLETFVNFTVRYHHHGKLLHSLIVRQTQYIIKVLSLLTDYDNNCNTSNKNSEKISKFVIHQSYSARWIMSLFSFNMALDYESGKRIFKIWNDIATQNLIGLIKKYQNEETSNKDDTDSDKEDEPYYQFILPLLANEYPIDAGFCQHFLQNVLKFCFQSMTIETDFERKLFIRCLTNNGKLSLLNQELALKGHEFSVLVKCAIY